MKPALIAIMGAGAALAVTPVAAFAQDGLGPQAFAAEPGTCVERIAQIEERMQNAPQKQAETRESVAARFEERLANLPEEKREEARAQFEAMQAKRIELAEGMKAKQAEVLARLRAACEKDPNFRPDIRPGVHKPVFHPGIRPQGLPESRPEAHQGFLNGLRQELPETAKRFKRFPNDIWKNLRDRIHEWKK